MKKILLASTILVGTTGFAAAEVTFSGSAYVGIAATLGIDETQDWDLGTAGVQTIDADGDALSTNTSATMLTPEFIVNFTAGMMTTTDMGLEAGASVTVHAARTAIQNSYGDNEFGFQDFGGNFIGAGAVYLSGDWGRFQAVYDTNADDAGTATGGFAGDSDITFTYSNTWGDFGVSAYYVMVPPTSSTYGNTAALGTTNGNYGAAVTYSFGDYGIDVSYDYDFDDRQKATLVYGTSNIGAGVTASLSGINLAANIDYDIDESEMGWDASASYTMNAFTFGAQIAWDGTGPDGIYSGDLGDAGDAGYDWGLTAAYDLGGGVAINASYMSDYNNSMNGNTGLQVAKVGVSMAF